MLLTFKYRQDVGKRLDKAYQAFQRYDSFTYPQGGYSIKDKKLQLSKIGNVKIKMHRTMEGSHTTPARYARTVV